MLVVAAYEKRGEGSRFCSFQRARTPGRRGSADVNVGDVTGKAAVRWRVDGSNPVEEIATTRFLTRSATAAIVNAGATLRGTATAAGACTARCEVSTLIRSHAHFNMLSLSRN